MVYSTAYNMDLQTTSSFTVSSSQSQGFSWNQDLFASQYQQMCRVVYDGHEDTLEGLLEYIRRRSGSGRSSSSGAAAAAAAAAATAAASKYDEEGDEALTDCENEEENEVQEREMGMESTGLTRWRLFHPRVFEELNRPRRISERTLSFVSDSKNGTYNRCDTAVVEVESNTPENNHLKWLLDVKE